MNRFLTFLLLVISVVAASAANPTLENFDQTHFRTNNPPPGIIRTRLSSSNFDQSGDTWSITNVSGATGSSKWTNDVDDFMRVIPGNAINGIEITNVYIQKLLYNQGGNIWYGVLNSNLVAGLNELNPFNKNTLQLTGWSATPTDSYVTLSGGDGPGSLLIVENYSAGFGFCITNGTPQWDNPAQSIILPNGDWCPTAEGEQIWLRQNGHADWVEVLRVITSGPGFAIINPTDNYLPVRQNANTFADSDLKNVVGSGVVSILNASSQPMIELEKTGELTVYGYTNAPGEGIITVNTYMDTTFSVNQGFSAIPSLAANASVTRRNSPAYMTTGYAWDSDDSVSRTFLGYLRQAPSTGTIPISMLEINNGILGSTFRGIGVSDTQDALLGGAIGGSPANTSRTTNFAYVVTVQGTPSGTPRYATSEFSPVTVDTSNNLLYFYSGGAWRQSSTGASSAANWTAEGTTNSTLAGIARANGGVFTNGITAGASTFTGAVTIPDGATGTPGLNFSGSATSGLYARAAGRVNVTSAGTTAVEFDSGNARTMLNSAHSLAWSSSGITGAPDTFLLRDGAANTIQGGADSATATAFTFKGPDGSGTDKVGGALQLGGGKSTGTAAGGALILHTANSAGASGSSQNAITERFHAPAKWVTLTSATATTIFTIPVPATNYVGLTATVTVYATDGTDHQSKTSVITCDAINKAGTITETLSQVDNTTAASSGTLTATYDSVDAGSNVVGIRVAADSSLTETVLRAKIVVTAINSNGNAALVEQ